MADGDIGAKVSDYDEITTIDDAQLIEVTTPLVNNFKITWANFKLAFANSFIGKLVGNSLFYANDASGNVVGIPYTSAPTVSTAMVRDAAGRSQAVAPSAANDIVNLSYAQGNFTTLTTAQNIGGVKLFTSELSTSGGFSTGLVFITADLTLTSTHGTVAVGGSANVTLTLPPTLTNQRRRYIIKKTAAGGIVTIDGNAAEAIDGNLTITLTKANESIEIQATSVGWYTIGAGPANIGLTNDRVPFMANGVLTDDATFTFKSAGTVFNVGNVISSSLASAPLLKIGYSPAYNNGVVVNSVVGNYTAATGLQTALQIAPVLNQTGTAGWTILDINPTSTTVGTGAKLIQRWAVNNSPLLSVSSNGNIVGFGTLTMGVGAVNTSYCNLSSVSTSVLIVSANTTLALTHHTVAVNAASGPLTITLPAGTASVGRMHTIKKNDSSANTVTIDGNASDLIDSALTFVLTAQWESVTVQSFGSSWYITSHYVP